jgi:hypothetical protein
MGGAAAIKGASAKRPAVQAMAKPIAPSAWIRLGSIQLSPFGKTMLALAGLETIWGLAALSLGVISLANHGLLEKPLLIKLGVGWLAVVVILALLGGQALSRPVYRRGTLNGLRRGLQGACLFLFAVLVHGVALWGSTIFVGAPGDATAEVIAYTIFGVNVLVAGVLALLNILG